MKTPKKRAKTKKVVRRIVIPKKPFKERPKLYVTQSLATGDTWKTDGEAFE